MQAIVSHTLASHLLCGLLGRFKELMEAGFAKGERFEIPLRPTSAVPCFIPAEVAATPAGWSSVLSPQSARHEATSQGAPVSRCEARGRAEWARGRLCPLLTAPSLGRDLPPCRQTSQPQGSAWRPENP